MTEEPRGTGRFTLRKGPRWFLPESPDVIGQLQTQAELTAKGMRAFTAWAGGDTGRADDVRRAEH